MHRRLFLELGAGALLSSACGVTVGSSPPARVVPQPRPAPLLTGINAGFYGAPLPAATYALLASLAGPDGFLVRAPVRTLDEGRAVMAALAPWPMLRALLLVERPTPGAQVLLTQLAALEPWGLELLNEPNLDTPGFTALSPLEFGAFVRNAAAALMFAGFRGRVISGGLWQTTLEDVRDYLVPAARVWQAAIVGPVTVGLHWYGDTSAAVVAGVQQLLTGAPVVVTEFGLSTVDGRTPAMQAAYLDEQLAAFSAMSTCLAACVYALDCGPDPANGYDQFGIVTYPDRQPRPAVDLLRRWARA